MTNHVLAAVVLICAAFSSFSTAVHADLNFHWEDSFSPAEKRKLTTWLNETHNTLEELVGNLPFTIHLYMKRTNAEKPVPWAHTERSTIQGVHFHVDPSHSLQEFRNDWTAPHEFSHLVIPYVGRQYSWFAEGFASYMQYQVMHKMGTLSTVAMQKRYAKNLTRAQGRYAYDRLPFAKAAPKLRADRQYPTMYWGGAALFLQADHILVTTGKLGLVETLKIYLRCCRMQNNSLDEVIAALDRLVGDRLFAALLNQFRNQAGFPSYEGISLGPSGQKTNDDDSL